MSIVGNEANDVNLVQYQHNVGLVHDNRVYADLGISADRRHGPGWLRDDMQC